MLSLSYDQWANTSPPDPLPQLDLILTDHHHQHHVINHDLSSSYSSLHHHHPLIFPDPFSTPSTFPHHNPSPLPNIETLSGYPEDLNRVGLNLGGQVYYFWGDYDPAVTWSRVVGDEPKCQVDGCNVDLSLAKNYHRRHKVCEFHSKAAAVFAAGLTQRFCQQCSRFHVLSEFDDGKRSCRKRLADHNRRRRKSRQSPHPDHPTLHELEDASNSPSQKFPCNL
ncbi:hypothetical protein Cgig2_033291 [Carnegiea gigantea]|uniref:SBP-type domain-containing protein n=1 Tax=Carnegiea gigantea TaxID=171969 RepID=A0A9Q1KV75_9CARY|nr:hypothetical protein Cgig2_033291 [Carnegiea gigantea]